MDVAVWSEKLSPGKNKITPLADLQLHNVALGETLDDPSERTVVKMTYFRPVAGGDDDEEDSLAPTTTVICSLTPGKIEQYSCRLGLFDSEEYVFEVVGKNTVYLTGNYVSFDNGADTDSDEDEDEFDLREVSSDVEVDMDPAEFDSDSSRFEEVPDEAPKGSKRPHSDINDGAAESKAGKKAQKKMKNEDGQGVTTKADDEQKDTKGKKDKKDKKEKGEKKVQEITGGIKITDAKVGTGPQAKKGNTVSMRYVGKLQNGKVFDKNTKGKPFTFKLGMGEVIKGWDEGVGGMQVGGERSLIIPPHMAYGKRSQSGIPANSTLMFDVKLLEIK